MPGPVFRVRAASAGVCAVVVAAGLAVAPAVVAQAAVPTDFADQLVIGGLTHPTVAAFAPGGRVFIGEKSGLVKTYDSMDDSTASTAVDLRTEVMDYWDRGLLGLIVHPQYPAKPYVYALYSYDAEPGGTHPRWNDNCPTPPGATELGCVITGRLNKLTVNPASGAVTAQQPLITGWCQQFPSHSIGTVAFGPDGNLYVGGGDGANFNIEDYGQRNNVCGDPPSPAGTPLAAPDARGGALRSQSPRRPAAEPRSLDGAILRVNPDTGDGVAGNPFASSSDPNAKRIIAYGMRNQFRFGFRPGTKELWVGDVGWNVWEEINRIPDATDNVAENFGWPCHEGTGRQASYDAKNLTVCESLYTAANQTPPYYAYRHADSVVAGDGCGTGGSAINGVAFENGTGNYPAAYDGALFFADSSRGCIWAMKKGAGGLPDPNNVVRFVSDVSVPVQTLIGPDGNLYYLALGAGELRRVIYTGTNHAPTADAVATPDSGPAPLSVHFDGTGSSDPDEPAAGLSYAWDLDGDGGYDDATGPTATREYLDAEVVDAGLKVTDVEGVSDTDTVTVTVGEPPSQDPVVAIDTPVTALKWRVGDRVDFSGRASDPQDGPLPATAMEWKLTLQHCTTPQTCHAHDIQTFRDVSSGFFTAPDHSYPSFLDLKLTATDSDGNVASKTLRLEPKTVQLTFESAPAGLDLTVGGQSEQAPFTRTVIVGSDNSVSATSPQGTDDYRFVEWSGGGEQAHELTAPETASTYRASYIGCKVDGTPVPNCGGATPSAPREVSAVGGRLKALLSWQPPHWPGQGGVTKYKVAVSNGAVYDNLDPSTTSKQITGLTTGQSYTFTVTAYSSTGAGPTVSDKLIGTRLSSSASPSVITYGTSSVRVSGVFARTDNNRTLASKPIDLLGRPRGSATFGVLATGVTNASGAVSFTRYPDAKYDYRLEFAGSNVYNGSLSVWRPVDVRYAVTGAFADSTVARYQTATLSGRVDPGRPGQIVQLQYYAGGRWNASVTATLSQTSTYSFAIRKATAGVYTYRVLKFSTATHKQGISPTRKLTVS